MSNNTAPRDSETIIACNLGEEQLAARERELADEIFSKSEQLEELADGYALRFPGSDEWATRLFEFIAFERTCCPFFTFELVFEANQKAIWLRLRGGEGVKAMIKDGLMATTPPPSQS